MPGVFRFNARCGRTSLPWCRNVSRCCCSSVIVVAGRVARYFFRVCLEAFDSALGGGFERFPVLLGDAAVGEKGLERVAGAVASGEQDVGEVGLPGLVGSVRVESSP